MKYRRLGKSGLKVSELSFGSWVTFGDQVNNAVAESCLKAAYDAGINFFDNAEGYAAGQSCPEELIDLLALPEQNARVEAVLAIGGTRAQEALYPLADYDSSQDSSGDEWYPVKRVARRPHRA